MTNYIFYRTTYFFIAVALLMLGACDSAWTLEQDYKNTELQPIISSPKPQTVEDIATGIMLDVSKGSEYRTKRHDAIYDSIAVTLAQCGDSPVCYEQALASYNLLLNQIYQIALEKSDHNTRAALALSQQRWVSFREAERKAQLNYRKVETGSAMGVISISKDVSAIRERISELVMYLGICLV